MKGDVSEYYCGKEIKKDLIELMVDNVKSQIISFAKKFKYFFNIANCTPNIYHGDKIREGRNLNKGSTADFYREERGSLPDLKICRFRFPEKHMVVRDSTVWMLLLQKYDQIESF